MPGPNDFHFHNGTLMPGLGKDDPRNGGVAVREPARVDGRSAEAKRLKAIEAAEAQLAAERAEFEEEKKRLRAEKGAK